MMSITRPRGRRPTIDGLPTPEYLSPPETLSEAAIAYWRGTVEAFGRDWFIEADAAPLRRYCELSELRDETLARARTADPGSADGSRIIGALNKLETVLLALERALRITKTSRTESRTAGNAVANDLPTIDEDDVSLFAGASDAVASGRMRVRT